MVQYALVNNFDIPHLQEKKGKNNTIISIDTEKTMDKIQHTFMIDILNKLGINVT